MLSQAEIKRIVAKLNREASKLAGETKIVFILPLDSKLEEKIKGKG